MACYQENTGFIDVPPPRTLGAATWDTGGRGWFGTVQGGCDYQFGGVGPWQIVVGAFADYDFADIKGNLSVPGFNMVGSEKLDHSWSVGGRIGVLITPQLLTYFSAGYTEATFNRVDFVNQLIQNGIGTPTGLHIDGRTYNGWFLGAGDEYALSFLPGLFWKTEYRLARYDTQFNPFRFADQTLFGQSIDSKKWVHTVRSELVWHFNFGGAPLVAKY